MAKFTIIGMYEDTGKLFVRSVDAIDVWEAFGDLSIPKSANLVLVGAVAGHVAVIAPGDDSGRTCFSIDYQTAEE